jgi:WD40 repeat protein
MDGTVRVIQYESHAGGVLEAQELAPDTIKHAKYVRTVAWSPNSNYLASASADGCVQIHNIVYNGVPEMTKVEKIKTLNLPGPVESMCFHKDSLVCYARGTHYLSYFDVTQDFLQSKINLNQGTTGGFDEHVSFAVMDMVPHGDYLALATDASRNIILEFATGQQLKNLYGHQNDGYSQPKVAWSKNGQYLYGNTQDESTICVWDIASSEIVKRLPGHGQPIRDMHSSSVTDTMATTCFDKKTKIWLADM